MKAVLQQTVLSFGLFAAGLSLVGCDQVQVQQSAENTPSINHETTADVSTQNAVESFSQGNVFYIMRDVADFQLTANQHIDQLQQSHAKIQTALDSQNITELANAAEQLEHQLSSFNQALSGLKLKSQEIQTIKSNVMQTNAQLLETPLLNGEYDLSQVNLKQIEKQMGSIQNEMLKLAAMLLQERNPTDNGDLSDS